jgi:hypothetical protein
MEDLLSLIAWTLAANNKTFSYFLQRLNLNSWSNTQIHIFFLFTTGYLIPR